MRIRSNTYEKVCHLIASNIRDKVKHQSHVVLGLATGSTPIGIYEKLSNKAKSIHKKAYQGIKWQCIKTCGACCRIHPQERIEALEVLNEAQLKVYLEMVGEDGWCLHYDRASRRCRVYEERPDFCRVSSLAKFFNISDEETDQFAIQCCLDQIRSVYGGRSNEMKRFKGSLRKRESTNE